MPIDIVLEKEKMIAFTNGIHLDHEDDIMTKQNVRIKNVILVGKQIARKINTGRQMSRTCCKWQNQCSTASLTVSFVEKLQSVNK